MRWKQTFVIIFFLTIVLSRLSSFYDVDSNLLTAATEGNTYNVMSLLVLGADINAIDASGKTALMMAAEGGHISTVKTLLDEDIKINAADDGGWTALSVAEYRGHSEIIALLKESGASKW